MQPLTLKTYQHQALERLQRFLQRARDTGSLGAAWATERDAGGLAAEPYRHQPFGDTPCVCLRIPTGGGKTLLAAQAIPVLARHWRGADHPVVVWLVPSSTIRDQTLRALQRPGHPYRMALEAACGQLLSVLDLEAAPTLAPQDLGRRTVVMVATMQSFRVRQTQGRNVYAFSEEFDNHFRALADRDLTALERVAQADLDQPGQQVLTAADLGRVKHSLANLLALTRPIVVVDEAHNAKTDTTFETLRRIAPSVILELTATPVPKKTNVLYSVSARELQAEEMIKLPIVLTEHRDWAAAVRDAVLRRRQLEAEAAGEDGYVRPIVLFQAQDRSGELTPEALRRHLIDEKLARDDEIVIATGEQRGLDGIDLFDPACPVRHVITVEALREGWDCSFAYVLCSLQSVRSARDVEQLLGRVLRMPYARRRRSPALNRAYAHVVARSFAEAATALVDRMVQGMGFEPLEAAAAVLPEPPQDDLFGPGPALPPSVILTLELPASAASALRDDPDLRIEASADDEGLCRLQVQGEVGAVQLDRLLAVLTPDDRPRVRSQVERHNLCVAAALAPAQRGTPFLPLPRLCVGQSRQGQAPLQLFERDTLDEIVDFDLLRADPRPELPGFELAEQADVLTIYLNQSRLEFRREADRSQLSLDAIPTEATDDDLVARLVRDLRRPAIVEAVLRRWVALLVAQLRHERGFSLTALLRVRHLLTQQAIARLDNLASAARQRGFEQLVLPGVPGVGDWVLGVSPDWTFRFEPGRYPARHVYPGRWRFGKHYFEHIHALKAIGEEFECARVIDGLPQVRHWVRNIEQQPRFSFWFPTATDYFYPDFVAELHDGRLLVVEYKGEAYASNDDSREKRAVGLAWARQTGGRGLFVMVEATLDGLDMRGQLLRALG